MHTRGSIHQWIPRREDQTVQSLQLQEVVAGALTIIACALTIARSAQDRQPATTRSSRWRANYSAR